MKAKSIVLLLVIVAALAVLFYSFTGSQDPTAYLDQIKKERTEKDQYMRSSGESPFAEQKEKFNELVYFPADPDYKVNADLIPIEQKQAVVLTTNDGKEQHYIQYAYADFDLGGKHNRLVILEVMEEGATRGNLFLAFGDETSARETYGAGRYLDVRKAEGSNNITLDFNKAYNPYCAYAPTYSCPLPPRENLLDVAILAGEKNYEH